MMRAARALAILGAFLIAVGIAVGGRVYAWEAFTWIAAAFAWLILWAIL